MSRIDIETLEVTDTVDVGDFPTGVAVSDDAVRDREGHPSVASCFLPGFRAIVGLTGVDVPGSN